MTSHPRITRFSQYEFDYLSSDGKTKYLVNVKRPNCTCRDFTIRSVRNRDHLCYHIRDCLIYLINEIKMVEQK